MTDSFLSGRCQVVIGGQDVTSRWFPILESMTVTKSAGSTTHSFEAVLADKDGETVMPSESAEIRASLGTEQDGVGLVFEGFVTDVRSSGNKGSGRTLSISGSSADQKSKIKEPGHRYKDDSSFSAVAKEWGGKVGLDVTVIGSIAGLERKYWHMQQESFMSWGQRTAKEIGASFNIVGKRAFFAPRNEGMSASGKPLTPVNAAWGDNLVSWDVTPIVPRPQFKDIKPRWYDLTKAKWIEETKSAKVGKVEAQLRPMIGHATKDNADQGGESQAKESEREKGSGTVDIVGDYAAEPEANCNISGARPGVDGAYRIDSVTHKLAKGSGFTTSLSLKQPDGGAGTDTR